MNLTAKIYTDETAARKHLEALLWPNGPVCPHCGSLEAATKLKGKSTRPGVYWCNACQKPYSVTVGTVYERSHIPLHKWLLATELLTASKKGMSAHQLMRMLGLGSYRSAWFMAHRIRHAMAPKGSLEPMGGDGKVIEIDETYIGRKSGRKTKPGVTHKHMVIALVERGGSVRSFHVKGNLNKEKAKKVLFANADRASEIVTDEARAYQAPGAHFAQHGSVNHKQAEYVRGDLHTNTIEGYFSVFKRGMIGTYQHVGEQHLQRYLHEFDFRYSNREAVGINDTMRAAIALKGISGKRLTYRRTDSVPHAKATG